MQRILLSTALLFALAHCERGSSDRSTSQAGPKTAPSAGGPAAISTEQAARASPHRATTPGPTKTVGLSPRLKQPTRELIVAIGDLHGDLAATRRALRLAGALDESDHWAGGALTVVQTGDVIDRGDEDRDVLALLERVQAEAELAGGQLIVLNGNHEVMNVAADFRYVTTTSLNAFAAEGGREKAFAPGGPFARKLAQHSLLVMVGNTVFVHGGILPKHVNYGLDRMNDEVQAWMRGELPSAPDILMVADGLIWTRLYSSQPADCEQLKTALESLGAARMVVGHTVQAAGINAGCGGLVWRIDVGLSAFYGGPTEVLELRGDTVSVKRAP